MAPKSKAKDKKGPPKGAKGGATTASTKPKKPKATPAGANAKSKPGGKTHPPPTSKPNKSKSAKSSTAAPSSATNATSKVSTSAASKSKPSLHFGESNIRDLGGKSSTGKTATTGKNKRSTAKGKGKGVSESDDVEEKMLGSDDDTPPQTPGRKKTHHDKDKKDKKDNHKKGKKGSKSDKPPRPSSKSKAEKEKEEKNKLIRHSQALASAFKPIYFFLILIGQMPFQHKKKSDGTYAFKWNTKSFVWFYFVAAFLLNSVVYFLVTIGIVSFALNFSLKNPTLSIPVKNPVTEVNEVMLWERYYTRREMVSVVVIWGWMTVSFVGSVHHMTHAKFYAHYMNYFNRVARLVDMDLSRGVKKYVMKHNIFTAVVAVCMSAGFGAFYKGEFTSVGNTSAVLANFIFRLFGFEMEAPQRTDMEKVLCRSFGFLIMMLALVGSRANVMQFLFHCQLLKNACRAWNGRLEMIMKVGTNIKGKILQGKEYQVEMARDTQYHHHRDSQMFKRLELRHMLSDHRKINQMFHMTETVFGAVILVHYFFGMVAVVMEIYQLAALGGFSHIDNLRDDDVPDDQLQGSAQATSTGQEAGNIDENEEWNIMSTAIVCTFFLLQNIVLAVTTTNDAAVAGEQAMEGFWILRQHGFMYSKSVQDRNFVWTMWMSFTKNAPLQITGKGYFAITKVLLVSMVAAVISWAVSIYQTKVDQWS